MAEKLTRQQQMAVDDRGGRLLVSAAAGSGKTKVLVDRLLKYIQDPVDPANVDDFLMITYTKAAAAELRGKIAAKLSEHVAQDPGNRHLQRQLQRLYLAKISTVHGFCADILREYAYRVDVPGDFRVGDESECIQLRTAALDQVLERAYAEVAADPDFRAFVDTQGMGRTDSLIPEIIQRVYDSALCHIDPEEWCRQCVENAIASNTDDPAQTVWGAYLLQDLRFCLDGHISAIRRCVDALQGMTGMEKPAALMNDTLYQLEKLRQCSTWDQVVRHKDIDYGRLTFPKKFDDPAVTEPIKAVRTACKEQLQKKLRVFSDPADKVLLDLQNSAAAARGLISLVKQFSAAYAALKRSRRILDFSDLEQRSLDLLLGKKRSAPTAVAREIEERFREIMVDEYQDSNGVQDAIFCALTQRKQNLFMVGDVKQSIYQFRLADPGIFLEKYASYVPAEEAVPGQGRKILLSSNFRSGGGVIEAVNFVFERCASQTVGGMDYGEEEALREGIPHLPLPDAEVELHALQVQEDTYAEEAAFVAERICQLLDGKHLIRSGDSLRPICPEDIVILLRSPGSVGMEFQYALEQRGIRCASGSGMDLLLTEEVATLRAILQIISNPRQDIPLLTALASPVFGFSADDLAKLRAGNKGCCIYEALCTQQRVDCSDFLTILGELRKASAMSTLPELMERIFRLTRLDAVYSACPDGQIRKENLQSFYQLAVDYAALGTGNLDSFLLYLDSLGNRGLSAASDASAAGCVTIMSIHKSKGLEFPVVFLCGLSRRFNQDSLRESVLCHKELGLGLSCVDAQNRVRYPALSKSAIAAKLHADGVSEELRVLYVAMTRARDRLIMTYASDSLDKELKDLSMRMDFTGKEWITSDVSCPGQWILYSALQRTEAGEFFALGGKPSETVSVGSPWKITVQQAEITEAAPEEIVSDTVSGGLDPEVLEQIAAQLSFRYAHSGATKTPSKQTATQRKGRQKDMEAEEDAGTLKYIKRDWRKPAFREEQRRGKDYGSAIHAVLQYIRYESCSSLTGIREEIQRLVEEGYVSAEYGNLVDAEKLERFFASDFGCKVRNGGEVLREFKFSILDDAGQYGPDLEGEQVLLQGVVDCALVEEDGITVIDFKTDYVTEETLPSVADSYATQVQTYADALQRIFERPVKAKALYFFCLDRYFWL